MVEMDAEEHFVHAASMENYIVICGLAGHVVGHFEVELGDRTKGCEHACDSKLTH